MSIKNQDDLNKLLNTFMDSDSAAKAAEDFRQADLIFEKYNSAEPGAKLLANIKANIGRELMVYKENGIKEAWEKLFVLTGKLNYPWLEMANEAMLRFAAVAAVFLVAVSVWFAVNRDNPQQNTSPAIVQAIDTASAASIWDSEDVTTNDAQYETFEREIEQIESEIVAIKYEVDSTIYGESELTEIENDLIEIQSDFWKG